MNTLGLSLLSVFGFLILFGSRRWALLGMLAGILFLTQGQYLDVEGFNLYPMRLLEVVALCRMVARGEYPAGTFNRLDRVFILLYTFSVVVFVLRSDDGLAYQIGTGIDAICLYLVFRSLLRNMNDLRWMLRGLVILLLPYVYLLWVESLTFLNLFAPLGGVELIRSGDAWVRGGRLRATGSFGHPSLLGTLGGTFLSLYIGLWFARPAERITALAGILLCLGIVGAANSGGPALCVVATVLGWMLWPIRRSMRFVRWTIVVLLVLLAMVMNAPIWYLLARISSITAGDGYHRAILIDIGINNIDRWWLVGMSSSETASWLPYTNVITGVVDMTNNFLKFGVSAGLGAIILLVALIAVAFSETGRAMLSIRSRSHTDIDQEPIFWGLGVMLATHVINWFGITYWDQTSAVWYLHIAMIGSLAGVLLVQTSQAEDPIMSDGIKGDPSLE